MFADKKIMVTGATSGIGFALAKDLLAMEAEVFAVGRNSERLAELQIIGGARLSPLTCELTDFSSYAQKFSELSPVDGLVCSAGVYETTLLRYFSVEKHEAIMRTNLSAPLVLISELLKKKRFNPGASIVLLSSILGPKIGLVGSVSYAASKAALVGCVKTLAIELAKYSIRVNCVSPGMVQTEMTQGLGYMSADAIEADMAKYPLGHRYATVSEVTSPIRFLLSEAASFITGTNIVIDGGCSAQ